MKYIIPKITRVVIMFIIISCSIAGIYNAYTSVKIQHMCANETHRIQFDCTTNDGIAIHVCGHLNNAVIEEDYIHCLSQCLMQYSKDDLFNHIHPVTFIDKCDSMYNHIYSYNGNPFVLDFLSAR